MHNETATSHGLTLDLQKSYRTTQILVLAIEFALSTEMALCVWLSQLGVEVKTCLAISVVYTLELNKR